MSSLSTQFTTNISTNSENFVYCVSYPYMSAHARPVRDGRERRNEEGFVEMV